MAFLKPATLKATEYIESLLNRTDISVLPSIREMAGVCGVSAATVWKIVSKLQKENRLVSHWGNEIRVGRDLQDQKNSYKRQQRDKWEEIRELCKKEFLSGNIKAGTALPSIKELEKRYQASYLTIKKVLDAFVSSGKIEADGRTYRIAGSRLSRQWRPVIIVICAGNHPGIPKIITERERDFYQSLTIEISRSQLELRYMIYQDWDGEPVFYSTEKCLHTRPPEDDSVFGYIVLSWHMKDLQECLFKLNHVNKPVAVWLESDYQNVIDNAGNNQRFFNVGYTANAGKDMAEHLLRLGHREIAFISPFHKSKWSKVRLSGIIDAFSRQGPGYKVHQFTLSNSENEWDFTNQVLQRNDLNEVFNLQGITEEADPYLVKRVEFIRNEGIKLLRDTLILKEIKQFLDYIYQNPSITALVGANDHCTLLSLDYLRGCGVNVPSRLSLAGFDNSFDALINGLTSYSFNTHLMVHSMIEYITGSLDCEKSAKVIFFDGTIIERTTTANILSH
ncbi:MAG TPA: substrate-binding domain-containing protein [Chitinispirillaceae bacterium]|nr:substrate-binding domain-containing protein [Chitinispirillaceae bacterium]